MLSISISYNMISCKTSKETLKKTKSTKYCFQNRSLAYNLWKAADSFWCQYFDNCGHICFLNNSYYCGFPCPSTKKSFGLVYAQFWRHRPSILVFFDKIEFPDQTVNLCLSYIIRKLTVHLRCSKTLFFWASYEASHFC